MKIKMKIVWSFLIFFTVLVGVAGFVIGWMVEDALLRQVSTAQEATVQSRARQVNLYLQDYVGTVKMMSSSIVINDFLSQPSGQTSSPEKFDRAHQRLDQMVASDLGIKQAAVLDQAGRLAVATEAGSWSAPGAAIIDRLEKDEIYFEDVHFSDLDGRPCFSLALPIRGAGGDLIGGLWTEIDLDRLYQLLAVKTGSGETGETYLVNRDGYAVSPLLFFPQAVLQKKVDTAASQACLQKARNDESSADDFSIGAYDSAGEYVDYRGRVVLGAYDQIVASDWCLITEADKAEVVQPITSLMTALGFIFTGGFVVCLVLALVVGRRISQPLEKLQAGLKIIEAGNWDYRVGLSSNDEIGSLSRSVDSLAATIKESRTDIDQKVALQTQKLLRQQATLEKQQSAMLNVLEDVEGEKDKAAGERDKIDKILHSIGDGVMVVDRAQRIMIFNEVAEKITGYKAAEVRNRPYREILKLVLESTGEASDDFVARAMRSNQVTTMTEHSLLIRKDGRSVPVADSAAPLQDDNGRVMGCVVIFRDVSQEREVDRMKTEFVSVASHQLRTPLSAIKWFLEMIINGDMGKVNPKQLATLKETYNSNERMIHLVNDLLNVSRLESGRIAVAPVPTDLRALSEQVITELQPLVRERRQKIKFSLDPDLPKLKIDPKLISQVIQNILSNASKYSPPEKEITYTINKKGDYAVFAVRDQGWGIPKNQQNRVFQRFFRGDNIISKIPEGTGLGLYVAKEIIEVSGGEIGFSSTEGRGSTFWFSLPLSGSQAKAGDRSIS